MEKIKNFEDFSNEKNKTDKYSLYNMKLTAVVNIIKAEMGLIKLEDEEKAFKLIKSKYREYSKWIDNDDNWDEVLNLVVDSEILPD